MSVDRRKVVLGGVAGVLGAGAAVGTEAAVGAYRDAQPLPFYGGYASMLAPDPTRRVATSGRIVWAAAVTAKAVALTFDDGPHPEWTPRVLDALDEHDVPGTFFCKGVNVAAHGKIHEHSVGRHELGNHTWSHPDLGRLTYDEVHEEIARCSRAMRDAWGLVPTLFRPPYGHVGGSAVLAAAAHRLTMVAWSGQFRESRFHKNPDGIVDDVVSLVAPGAIVLGHDTGKDERLIAIDRLGRVISRLKADGWTFHTVSQLLAMESAG